MPDKTAARPVTSSPAGCVHYEDDPDTCTEFCTPRTDECPHRCGYRYPIAACVRLHLIQHHDYGYREAQEAYPDE